MATVSDRIAQLVQSDNEGANQAGAIAAQSVANQQAAKRAAAVKSQQMDQESQNKIKENTSEQQLKQQIANQNLQTLLGAPLKEGQGASLDGASTTKGFNTQGKAMQNESQARKGAIQFYNQNSKGLEDTVDAAKTGLVALQNNDASSLGVLRAAYLSANGFKRFNEPEALANAPDSVKADIASLLNKAGLDTPGGNLTDVQRGDAVKFFNGKLDEVQDRHNALKQQAQQTYSMSTSPSLEGIQALQSIGSPIDNRITSTKAQYDKFHTQAIPNTPATGSNAPSTGIFSQAGDKLKSWLGGGASQTPQNAQGGAGMSPGGGMGQGGATGPHGASVMQGGVQYNWNPQAGQYE